MISWAKYLNFDEHAVQERERLTTTPDEQAQLRQEIELTKRTVGRRKLLVVLLGGAFVSTFVGLLRTGRLARPQATRRARPYIVDQRCAFGHR